MIVQADKAPHWQFSQAVYGLPDVAPSCLLLQDRCGVDVNVLLLALYAAVRCKQSLDEDAIAELDTRAKALRENVVVPLRQVRRHMKDADYGPEAEKVRQHVKVSELKAEELEQSLLAAWVAERPASDDPTDPQAAALLVVRHFLGLFCQSRDIEPEEETALRHVAAAALKVAS